MYDELVKRLRISAQWADKGLVITPSVCLEAADAIEELMRRCEQFQYMPPPAWVPVTERPPKKNGVYLVYVYGEVTEMNYWYGKWHMLRDDYTKAVTHWMPLPKPPKGEN